MSKFLKLNLLLNFIYIPWLQLEITLKIIAITRNWDISIQCIHAMIIKGI